MSLHKAGTPSCKRLDHREPEPLGEGRQQQRARAAQQRRHCRVGQRVVLDDRTAQRRAAIEHVDDVFDLPAALPDQNQDRRPVAEIAAQPAPQIEQHADGSCAPRSCRHRRNTAVRSEGRRSPRQPADRRRTAPSGPGAPGRRDRDAAASAAPVTAEFTITASANAAAVSMRRRWFAAWPGFAYSGNSIGIRSWIRQTKRARLARFQARDQSSLFEMVVRDQQIDGAAGTVAQQGEKPPLASGEQREAGAARDPPHPPFLLARIERPAPGRADFADKVFGDPARQQRQPAVRRDAPRKRTAARSRSGARHRRARPGRCRSASRGRRATRGATDPERSLRRLLDQRRAVSVRAPRARCAVQPDYCTAFLTTIPVMTGPVSVFSKVKNFCSSFRSALAT